MVANDLTNNGPKVLYVTYWGALEPLGRSLVIPAVLELAQMNVRFILLTFEKPDDLERERCDPFVGPKLSSEGILWYPHKYHKRPKIPATMFDIARGIIFGTWQSIKENVDIIHARNFIGGLIGMAVAALTRRSFVYHNEGFYPDEQVDGDVWSRSSYTYKVAKFLENLMYERSDAVIALSYRAAAQITEMSRVDDNKPIIVVPSCVDLDHFHGRGAKLDRIDDVINLVYIGSVGARYILDRIGRFIATINRETKRVHLSIFSRSDPDLIREMLAQGGLVDNWSLESVFYEDMPRLLPGFDAGLFFLKRGSSEHGCSPTKIGEYWASGIPVVTTPNVSDTDDLISRHGVGVIVEDHSDESYLDAFRQLQTLLASEDVAVKCRNASIEHYGLKVACLRQFDLYKQLTVGRGFQSSTVQIP